MHYGTEMSVSQFGIKRLKVKVLALNGCPYSCVVSVRKIESFVTCKEMISVLCLDMTTTMALLTPAHRQDKCVSHALQIRAAWALSNYHRFFRLYLCAPKMSGYIIDWFLERERKQALKIMIKSYVSFRFFA